MAGSLTLALTSVTALAQFQNCSVDDSRCLEDLYYMHCAERGSDFDSCQTFALALQNQRSITPTTQIGETLGSTYYRLADIAIGNRDRATDMAYRARARQVFLDVVANDETAVGAYAMLGVLDNESLADSIVWMRPAVELDDQKWIFVQGFVGQLFQLGTPDAISEAIEVAENAYFNAVPSWDKWRSAAFAYGSHQRVNIEFPGFASPSAEDEFLSRVKQDSDWENHLQIIDNPLLHTTEVHNALETVCYLSRVFDDGPCMSGIEATVEDAVSNPMNPDAQMLADAAANAMIAARRGSSTTDPDSRTKLMDWLNQILNSGLDSVAVLETLASISLDREQRREVRREIVSRIPNSGEARFQLGKEYYDHGFWAEAVVELELSSQFSPPEDQLRIQSYLRQAEYELGNND